MSSVFFCWRSFMVFHSDAWHLKLALVASFHVPSDLLFTYRNIIRCSVTWDIQSTLVWIVMYLPELFYLRFCNDAVSFRLYGTEGQDNLYIMRWKGCGRGRLWPNCRQSLALTTHNIIGVHRVWIRDLSVSLTLTSHIVFVPKVSSLFSQYVTCPLFQALNFWCSAHRVVAQVLLQDDYVSQCCQRTPLSLLENFVFFSVIPY
jgi:hypothetical protein